MQTLYNISIYLYIISIHIYSLFNTKAKLWVKGRRSIFKKIKNKLSQEKNIVWIHCASLGEFEQAKPIIINYRKKYQNHKILLTFFSSSGYEVQKDYKHVDWVFYLPADTKKNSKQFLDIVKPLKVIFIKYEFWFNYIQECKKRQVPFYMIASVFRKNQFILKYEWFEKQLSNISHFFVQDKKSALLLNSKGIYNTTVTSDTRFDNVILNRINKVDIPIINDFVKDKKTIIFGSTWKKDEDLLISFIKKNDQLNYILAPHELHNIESIQKKTKGLLYSKYKKNKLITSNILIIDKIGILSNIYQYGDLAYVGGGFGKGIHNILEPLTFGVPVIFGPNYKKYNEAKEVLKKGIGYSINNLQELTSAFKELAVIDNKLAIDYIEENSGATKEILKHI
tara:strand:- start:1974 stop:3158 length:1185 start_codon:yes stop_codon:yes gene_type:complete